MKKIVLVLFILSGLSHYSLSNNIDEVISKLYNENNKFLPDKNVLQKALIGYNKLRQANLTNTNKNIITVIDFTKASDKKRMWVIDLNKFKVLFHCYVAHGKNTGVKFATTFSNRPNSNMSSLGFYTTGKEYYGKHGLSLRLHGRENGINDNAFKRAVVIHTADYVSEDFIKKYGRLGRSFGCPALSKKIGFEIIDTISEGTCLFIYYPDQEYNKKSSLLNGTPNFHAGVY